MLNLKHKSKFIRLEVVGLRVNILRFFIPNRFVSGPVSGIKLLLCSNEFSLTLCSYHQLYCLCSHIFHSNNHSVYVLKLPLLIGIMVCNQNLVYCVLVVKSCIQLHQSRQRHCCLAKKNRYLLKPCVLWDQKKEQSKQYLFLCILLFWFFHNKLFWCIHYFKIIFRSFLQNHALNVHND